MLDRSGNPIAKTTRLRELIESPQTEFLMEAHSGLSARIVEEAGFSGIWGSGLSISASLGLRDNNEATWTQVLEVLEFMSDATSIPILVDGDTGYGDFNTMRRLVTKLESRDIAGVCIEDKCFPKTNSFIGGTRQALADIDEFCGKIKAGLDARHDEDFVIVARVEAFIAGLGLAEAMKRATAYMDAGVDAILIHSAQRVPREIFAFLTEWDNRLPVVVVPTKYFTTPTEEFRRRRVATVIWANHNLRGSIAAMQRVSRTIFREQHLQGVEESVVPVAEVFRLQGADELAEAEKRYLPEAAAGTRAIILAYTRGEEMGELTAARPKAMVEVGGVPLLTHIAESMRFAGIRNLNVVRGYCGEAVSLDGATLFDSPTELRMNELQALATAREAIEDSVIICYGDVLFKRFIVTQLLDHEADFAVMIDSQWQTSRNRQRYADYVVCSREASRAGFQDEVTLRQVVHDEGLPEIHGEWMGFLRLSPRGSQVLRQLLDEMAQSPDTDWQGLDMAAMMNLLIARGHKIHVLYTAGNWLDCDSVVDIVDGGSFTS